MKKLVGYISLFFWIGYLKICFGTRSRNHIPVLKNLIATNQLDNKEGESRSYRSCSLSL